MTLALPLGTATGGSTFVVALTFVGLAVTAVLSLLVAYSVYRGYRQNRHPARLYLAIGLVLLTTGPIAIQFALTNFTDVPAVGRSAAANASKLLGLGAMLYSIYGIATPRTIRTDDADRSEEVRE